MAQDTIAWLFGLQRFGIKLGLDNIQALLELLDRPDAAYPALLVGGTNGKGSVSAMIDALLAASGVRAGLFTSPHLVRPHERIRVAGADIGSVELQRTLDRVRRSIEAGLDSGALLAHPSFFEVITATALLYFREQSVAAAVLEVGLGGRLDATNAVAAELSVITGVDLDHTQVLGERLEQIAWEKAGIVKPGKPVICGVLQQGALDVVQRVSAARGSRWIDPRSAARLQAEDGDSFTLETRHGVYRDLRLALVGRHQLDNARLALAAYEVLMETLGLDPDPAAVREGLAAVRWPGRLQWLEPADGLARLLLDGAHNPAGLRSLIAYLRARGLPAPVLLFGATEGRPLAAMLGTLSEAVEGAVLTRPPVERAIDPFEAAQVAGHLFQPLEVVQDCAGALGRARSMAGSGRFVLVTGSLYLVGTILGILGAEVHPGPIAM